MLDFSDFYHVGIVVPELEAALAEHRAVGVSFAEPIIMQRTAEGPDGPIPMDIRACYAMPPAGLELVQEMPGTMWTAGERGRLHHLGFRAPELEAKSAELAAAGWPAVAWNDGWVYHESPLGYYIELVGPEIIAAHEKMFG